MAVKFDLSPLLSAFSNLQYRQLSHIVHLSKTDTWGAFHLGKISGSTGLNANGTRNSIGNFPEQADDLLKNSPFSVPTGWNRNSRSIFAILFRPAFGDWNFQFLPVSAVHEQSHFFFLFISYLIVQNGICTSVARTLGGFSRKMSCLLLVKTKNEFHSGWSTRSFPKNRQGV